MARLDIRSMYSKGTATRNLFLQEAQKIADLTLPRIEPMPGGQGLSSNASMSGPVFDAAGNVTGVTGDRATGGKVKLPFTSAGARAALGLCSVLISSLYSVNVRFFKLETDPSLDVDEQATKQIDSMFSMEEDRYDKFLNQQNFQEFAINVTLQCLIEGQTVVKVDPKIGFMMYPLRSFVVRRYHGRVKWIIIEELIDKKIDGEMKCIRQYIFINKEDNEVWVQTSAEEYATLTDEDAVQYFVVSTTTPNIDDYARSYFSDHYPLLNSINKSAEALLEAKANASWNFMMYSGSRPIDYIASIQPREVVPVEQHGELVPFSFGVKISEWEFVARQMTDDIQNLLTLSGVGLTSRASQAKTATEINAILHELNSLIGATSQVLSRTLFHNTIEALMEILDTNKNIKDAFLASGVQVSQSVLDKIAQPVIVTGTSAFAREQDAERMLEALANLVKNFGPQSVLPYINIPETIKTYLKGVRVNTSGMIVEQPQVNQIGPATPNLTPDQIQQMIQQQGQQPPPPGV